MPGFDDRTVSLAGAAEQLADLGSALSSRTRVAVLAALIRSDKPLHINELARRVGVDASPVRTHLELLLKQGLAREVDSPTGRERFFESDVAGITITIEGVNKPRAPKDVDKPKTVLRLERKMLLIEKESARLTEKARRVQEEMSKAWGAAAKTREKKV